MKKILIVEDDVDTIDMVELILREAGYAVIKINREVPFKEITGINPNLIILDYLLPFGLGTDLCLQLKTNELTKHYPIILYSASNILEKLAKESHADAYIAKPFDLGDFITLVNKWAL